ncbi:MAG: glycosyltransferase [Dehalococcoidia bacterium]
MVRGGRLTVFALLAAFWAAADRVWKLVGVLAFFSRPRRTGRAGLVSILQPILGGDPALEGCLRHNLLVDHGLPVEFVWLLDEDDEEGIDICERLAIGAPVRLVRLPPPPATASPKLVKLIAGLERAAGDTIAVLDDDTMLRTGGLAEAVAGLDEPDAGLAFGIPCYRSFDNLPSALVSLWVNANSLMTYLPYLTICDPLTINGMFYVLRRDTLRAIGGFSGLEHLLADDFAVASRVRSAGLRLVQTPVIHPIQTTVIDGGHYRRLMGRWLAFPRESLLRHLTLTERTVLAVVALVPSLLPAISLGAALLSRRKAAWLAAGGAILLNAVAAATVNERLLGGATPRRWLALDPFVQLLTPLHLIGAMLGREMDWRGHRIRVQPGGSFEIVSRRGSNAGR